MFKNRTGRKMHLIIIAFATGLFLGINFSYIASAGETAHKYLGYFHRVYQIVSTEYVDEPDNKTLFYGAIRGMLASLGDQFTRFMDEESNAQFDQMISGKFVGIGVEIAIRNGEMIIVSPIEGSPALRAGLEPGDVITKVNDETITGQKYQEVLTKIKGIPGSKVKIHIKRENYPKELVYDIERAPIKIDSVEYGIIDNYNTGYLKIKSFGNETAGDVRNAVKFFRSKKIGKLVIDVRQNPGGLLPAAIEISDMFLDQGKVIVSTKGRTGDAVFYKATSPMLFPGKTIILVNRGSASASEILSGALRDNNRAMLLGEKTFGKGSVQIKHNLDKNISVAVTAARYYTPSGAMIHKKGIKPDYDVKYFDIPKKEDDDLKKVYMDKILTKFVNMKTEYDDKTKRAFTELLKKNEINLSEKTSSFILKREISKYRKKELYDLEFDSQLKAALAKLQ